jgi:hypothetical protein
LGHLSRNFAKISRATSVSSLKDRSTCRSSFVRKALLFHAFPVRRQAG